MGVISDIDIYSHSLGMPFNLTLWIPINSKHNILCNCVHLTGLHFT